MSLFDTEPAEPSAPAAPVDAPPPAPVDPEPARVLASEPTHHLARSIPSPTPGALPTLVASCGAAGPPYVRPGDGGLRTASWPSWCTCGPCATALARAKAGL